MAKLFYTNIDLKGNQLQNGVIHNAASAPIEVTAVAGQVYYNTDDKLMYQYDGTQWVVVGGSVEELLTDVTKVVTGSSTDKGTAKLNTTALSEMKVGVGLQNLATVDANTTLEDEFQAIDTALQDVKTTYVKAAGNYTGSNNILVAGVDGNGIKTASASDFSINNSTFNQNSNTDIPTSQQIANYIGSLAGGITYKGTVDSTHALPEVGVKVGDAYMVAEAESYAGKSCEVGDLIICSSISSTPPTWSVVPINFTVEDNELRNFAPASGLQTIATVDGKDITMSLKGIEIVESGDGVFVTGIDADGNNKLTLTKGNALTTVTPSSGTGVVTGISSSDNQTINVTYADLETAEKAGIQYVTNVSQASNGMITVSGTNFDGSISEASQSTTNAPTTSAVKTYVDGKINALDGSATIATVNDDDTVTLNSGITETDGIISNSGSNIVLAKVAKTGSASDVNTEEITDTNGDLLISAGNVQNVLQTIARDLDAAVSGSVTSFGGKTGVIEVGNGLTMTNKGANSEVSANVTGYIVNNKGTDNKALDIDSAKVDKTYSDSNVDNLATVATVTAALNTLVVDDISGFGAGKTLANLTETNGKIAATFQDISIKSSQISDKTDTYSTDGTVAVTGKAVKAALDTLDVTAFALSAGETSSIDVYGISETDGKIAADTINKKTWNFNGTYDASTNKIALQSTVTNALGTLNGTHNVVTISKLTEDVNDTTQKIEFSNGKQTNGLLETSDVIKTLYISNAVSITNPIITKSDLSGLVGAMVYKGTANSYPPVTEGAAKGDVYVASSNFNTYEKGDMFIYNGTSWDVVSGENQVTNASDIITAGAGAETTIATVDGTTITAQVNVTAGSATIATVNDEGVVTITPTVSQAANTGTIKEASGTKITLAKVATTGNSTDVTYNNSTSQLTATTTQAAIDELNSKINTANITIDTYKGAITTGDGLTDVTANGGSFGINLDTTNSNGLYLAGNTEGSKALAMYKATDSQFGTVKVTTGNGLTLTDGVIAYSHNTTPITVASKDTTTNRIIINGTLTPTASGAITPSGAIELAAVAASGAASDVTYSATIGGSTVNNVDDALDALNVLSGNAVYVHKQDLSFNDNGIATITISGADLLGSAITEIRDNSNNVVECDVTYNNNNTINVGINGSLPTGTSLYAIVHYKKAKTQA